MPRRDEEEASLNPMAQAEVEREIHRFSQELTRNTMEIGDRAMRHAQADVDYKRSYARAWVQHRREDGTVAEKEALIHCEVEKEYETMRLAEAMYKVAQERGRNLRTQIEALRTIAANVRQVMR